MPTFFFFYNNSLWCTLLVPVIFLKYKLLLCQYLKPVHIQAWKQPSWCPSSFLCAPFPRRLGMDGQSSGASQDPGAPLP